ncbi:hypothetical protein PR202_gb02475 [Eleusine coracana subsp. coracana]|uniref:Transcription factor n=1 Tax=Eleusine coracana subsp. coracana TaxID=191504 RepID=A0AAV5DWT9_ELECO|nr:hypothetical protein QOZ80_8BG0668080 [Eleusine coracana subsp. coracana]GJN15554.1 hypothetical protein PR202_gb02475 [Eleusine coracana subsp. coracana]
MDGLFFATASGSPSSAPSLFSAVDVGRGQQVVELVSCEILEQWLGDDDDKGLADKHSDGAAASMMSGGDPPPPSSSPAAKKKRGRKPGWSSRKTAGAAVISSHVEAERQRRNKLNRHFCDLRAAVPMVSKMDRASLLADATSYIGELRGRVEKLEAEAKEAKAATAALVAHQPKEESNKLEVRMIGHDAAELRLTTTAAAARHTPARLMEALRLLDLAVQHATVCRAGGVTVQDAVVDVPAGPLQDVAWLRAALIHRLQGSTWRSFPQFNY